MLALPAALVPFSAYRQFLLYKKTPGNRPGKVDKFPVSLATREVVDAHDAQHWVDATTAIAAAQAWGEPYGVAFVFTEGDPFFFVDVDKCRLPDGQWSPLALELVGQFPGAAVEVSQSGNGLHIFGSYAGALPEHRCRDDAKGLEFYHSGRFVALTGNCAGTGSAGADCTATVHAFITKYMPPAEYLQAEGWTDGPREDWAGHVDDDELLAHALATRSAGNAFGGKASFADLWHADADALAASYPSPTDAFNRSAADAALAQHLAFWTGCDCARIERLMQRSALVRDKWDRDDYLPRTVEKAARLQRDVHVRKVSGPAPTPPPPPGAIAAAVDGAGGFGRDYSQQTFVDGDPFLPPDRQIEFFKDCVYVLDRDQVLTPRGLLNQSRFRAMFGGWNFAMDAQNRRSTRNPWEALLESQIIRFPRADSTCFRPELPPRAIIHEGGRSRVNSYEPIATRREKGDPTPFLDLLRRQLPDERDRRVLLTYLAAMIQHKGRKFQWWPVLQSAEGNGKTLIVSAIRHAIGERYSFAPNVSEIAKAGNKFNGWIDGNLFVAMEEIYVPERRSFLEDFKTTVTNEWLPIERKGVDQVMADNRANGIMCTNHRDGVPITVDTRRYCVFYMAQQSREDIERDGMGGDYFPDLYDWAKGLGRWEAYGPGYGFAVVHEYLATYPLDPEFNPAGRCQRAPVTSSTRQAVAESLGSVEQAILEAVAEGRQGFCGGWVSSIFLDKLLADLRIGSRIPPSKRRALMQTIGYDWHPALIDGRANNSLLPDGSKPRLYVAKARPDLWALDDPALVAKAYSAAQLTPPSS